jgi:hypothetical protein
MYPTGYTGPINLGQATTAGSYINSILEAATRVDALTGETKNYITANLATEVLQNSEDLATITQQFGTFYDDAIAAAWYGLTVKTGELISGFTVGGVDTDTTTPGTAGSFFAISADTFTVARAIEDISDPAELAYIQANDLPYGTMYNTSTSEIIPAFLIDWNGTSYDIFFNGKVSFTNVADVPDYQTLTEIQALGYVVPSEVANAINTNTTTINGAKITTGSIAALQIAANTITASQIAIGTITANEIATNTITADKIATNAITADEIATGAVTATKISVTELSAISANIGTITAGTINADVVNAGVLNLAQVPTITNAWRYSASGTIALGSANSWTTFASVTITISTTRTIDVNISFNNNKGNNTVGMNLRVLRDSTVVYGSSTINGADSLWASSTFITNAWTNDAMFFSETLAAGTYTYTAQFASSLLSGTPYQSIRQRYMTATVFNK